jgi:hypothetical protein
LIDQNQLRMVIELAMALAVWPLLLGIFLVVGSRQSREGQGTAGRLWLVSTTTATLASLPLFIWGGSLLPPYSAETGFWFHMGLTAVSAAGVSRYLTSQLRIRGGAKRFPIVRDEEFLARVRELSAKMGIDPPRVRLSGLATDSQVRILHVCGLPAPTVVMSEVALHQLETLERDAILSLGLAHIATGALWWYASLVPMAAVAASFSTSFVSTPTASILGVAFYYVAKSCINRVFEARRRAYVASAIEPSEISSQVES